MRNKCLLGLGLVFVISLTSMVAFAFSFTGTPADEVDETEMIVRAVVSEEADAMPTTEPITTTGQEQEMVKKEQSKIGLWTVIGGRNHERIVIKSNVKGKLLCTVYSNYKEYEC